jgi:enterobacterial common antigen flippase
MMSPARATGILAIGTAATLLAGILVAKALAILTGPEGVGLYGLLQSLLGLATILFGLGVGTGIVRATARAVADDDENRRAALRGAGMLLAIGGGLLGGLLLILFRDSIATLFLGGSAYAWAVVLMAPALLLQLASAVEFGYLNGHHRVRTMAIATAGSSILGAAVIVTLVARWGTGALPFALVATSAVSLLTTAVARHRSVGEARHAVSRVRLSEAARWLVGFGGTYTLSQLVGTGAQLVIPVIVLSLLGHDSVGYVRAASAVAIGYLSVLLSTMGRDYYPRAAAAEATEPALRRLVSDQGRLILALSAPLILATSALAPMIIAILYSDAFSPATSVLQWMLVGDVLKLLSWTGSFVILARGGPGVYFLIELIGGTCLLVTTVVAVNAVGVAGVGLGYAITYAIYLSVVWVAVRPIVRMPVTSDLVAGIALATALAAFQVVRPGVPAAISTALLLGATAIALAIGWRTIRSGTSAPRPGPVSPVATGS